MLPFIFMHMNQLPKFVATFFGLGFIPVAPGTFGALGGFIVSYLLLVLGFDFKLFHSIHFILVLISYMAGVWACKRLSSEWGPDPSRVVIDETIGFWISILFLPVDLWVFLIGFVLFRFFDIIKPLGIRKIDQWHTPNSVMLDDVLAGIYTNVVLQVIVYFYYPVI